MISKALKLLSITIVPVLGLWLLSGPSTSAQTTPTAAISLPCKWPKRIDWPTNNPLWSFCWEFPWNSSGIDGSGLELTEVHYKGKKVFKRAHVPVVNVRYDGSACGPTYRDWANETFPFETDNELAPGYAEPTRPPRTVLDHPGTDKGTFDGVAAEKKNDELILTSQMSAGWYRYINKWTFKKDGTIMPQIGFTAVADSCLSIKHRHHAYWRFDFDIDGGPNDQVSKRDGNSWQKIDQEMAEPGQYKWQVIDLSSSLGYEIENGDEITQANPWAVANFWALLYKPKELDDGGSRWELGDKADAAHMSDYINKEKIAGQDLVIWLRDDFRHANVKEGRIVGPVLKPVGTW